MRRRAFVSGALALLAAPLAAEAQTTKVPHVGMILAGSSSSFAPRIAAFRQGLRDLGYVEGRDVMVEYRFAEGRPERFAALANDLVRLRVQVIVTLGTPATLAAKDATSAIPIVMASGSKRSRRSFPESPKLRYSGTRPIRHTSRGSTRWRPRRCRWGCTSI